MGEYLFPVEKLTSYFKSINSKSDLQKFIQQRSAHVTQNTLYGYLKTRSGKIMRRILRKIAANEPDNLGDTTTLADPSVVTSLVENRQNRD